jgi:hypothetical protein
VHPDIIVRIRIRIAPKREILVVLSDNPKKPLRKFYYLVCDGKGIQKYTLILPALEENIINVTEL